MLRYGTEQEKGGDIGVLFTGLLGNYTNTRDLHLGNPYINTVLKHLNDICQYVIFNYKCHWGGFIFLRNGHQVYTF